jgi:TolA-binding protein
MSPKNRAFSFAAALIGAALFSFGAAAAPEAKMSDLSAECVGKEAPKALDACPGGPSQFEGKKKHSAAFKSAPPPIEAKKRQDDVKPVNPDELKKYAERDTRKTRLQARARALLITEIQGLERLYKNTPQNSADKPQLTRRLAEGYVELESAALRDKIAADIQAQDAKAKKRDAGKFRSNAASAEKIVKAARVNAIKYYTLMKDKFPKYSKIDEVLYYLAYEYEQATNYDKAREVYLELIDKAPKSAYIPNAYLLPMRVPIFLRWVLFTNRRCKCQSVLIPEMSSRQRWRERFLPHSSRCLRGCCF